MTSVAVGLLCSTVACVVDTKLPPEAPHALNSRDCLLQVSVQISQPEAQTVPLETEEKIVIPLILWQCLPVSHTITLYFNC